MRAFKFMFNLSTCLGYACYDYFLVLINNNYLYLFTLLNIYVYNLKAYQSTDCFLSFAHTQQIKCIHIRSFFYVFKKFYIKITYLL